MAKTNSNDSKKGNSSKGNAKSGDSKKSTKNTINKGDMFPPEENQSGPSTTTGSNDPTAPTAQHPEVAAPVATTIEVAPETTTENTPADAPPAPTDNPAPVVTEETRVEGSAPQEAPAATVRKEKPGIKVTDAEAPAPAADTTAPAEFVGFGSRHSDEEKIEAYLKKKNGVTKLTDAELSKCGINMSKIGLITGRVGKYKLTRGYYGQEWKITVE